MPWSAVPALACGLKLISWMPCTWPPKPMRTTSRRVPANVSAAGSVAVHSLTTPWKTVPVCAKSGTAVVCEACSVWMV
jgi:hypothetical protein